MRNEEEIREKIEEYKQDILRVVLSGIFTEGELQEYRGYIKAPWVLEEQENE